MVQLSDFSSLFEISVAIHIAYSLLRSIHEEPIVYIENTYLKLNLNILNYKIPL